MTTLQERAAAAATLVPSLIDEGAAAQQAGHVHGLAEKVGRAADRLRALLDVAPEFGAGAQAAKAAATAADVADQLAIVLEDASRAIDAKVIAAERALTATVDGLEEEIGRLWQGHLAANPAPAVDEAQLKLFADAGFDVEELHGRVETLESRRLILTGRKVPGPDDHAGWNEVAAGLREVVIDLAALAPPEVRTFLADALAPRGAGLESLSPEVATFLAQRGLTGAFKVVKR
jgi:hypothetical protein